MMKLCTKFEIAKFIHYKDMKSERNWGSLEVKGHSMLQVT